MDFSNELIERLKKARVVSALTGAGVSAESGVPTFRDPGGIWEKFRPEQLANFEAFMSDPDFVWSWYQHRREIMREVMPNPGHYALVEFEKIFSEFNLITQNIDNLHYRAGSKRVTELHGNIERNYCVSCKTFYNDIDVNEKKVLLCKKCGSIIRPDVVWFGEILPRKELIFAEDCAKNSNVFFSIGTSAEVYPAAMLPTMAKQSGAYVVEINIRPTVMSMDVDEVLQGKSGEILSELVNNLKKS
ncbi:MAG: NAD-dependent deacylase [Chlorobi bacterium]|nr:NAD-dependent deacylase [Chlorobiota bacterium]MCI0715005.1 NAD-dependent deacylase [Chlorobiota bacterium]